jgi:hypothetical protein
VRVFVEERDFVRVGHCDFTLASFALEVCNSHEPGPVLIKGWPQCLHSSLRSMGRSRVESDIALLPRRAGAQVVSQPSVPGTVIPMMPTTLLLNVALRDHPEWFRLSAEDSHKPAGGWA